MLPVVPSEVARSSIGIPDMRRVWTANEFKAVETVTGSEVH